jgi:site-specific DNA recombinase
MKEKYGAKLDKLNAELLTAVEEDVNFKKLLEKDLKSLLSLNFIYGGGNNEQKQEVITAISHEKFRFEHKQLGTAGPNEAAHSIYLIDNEMNSKKNGQNGGDPILSSKVPRTGFEPAHPCGRCDLNTVRLPISPSGHSGAQR